jgi:glucose-6-phosphate isomerase
MAFTDFNQLKSYAKLQQLAQSNKVVLKDVLKSERIAKFQSAYDLGAKEALAYNYAAKAVDGAITAELQKLADEAELIAKYKMIASGEMMNPGEKRKVLHHLARGQVAGTVIDNGKDLGKFYAEQNKRIADFARKVHDGKIKGSTGQEFDTVVQVGIGGSDLGPRALYLALRTWVDAYNAEKGPKHKLRGDGAMMEALFMSNVDPDDAADVLAQIDPETSLFILVSKSGTTQETLTNEALVLNFLTENGIKQPKKHMICVTSETSPLAKSKDYLDSFFIDDFIGGRYSSTSAVGGAVLTLAFGPEVFAEILAGAHAVDLAALEPDALKNPALLDALIGVWERNFQGFPTTAVLPYSQAMSRFPAHLQQMDMESNGKQVNRDGQPVAYATGPVIFGEPGTNGQHSFYQLLHQGTDIIPLQFIGFKHSQDGMDVDFQGSNSQQKLNANLAAQIVAFATGSANENPNKNFPGERPSSLLLADQLTPRVLGALLAHFENKVMFQGLVWNLNSYDQEGVQLGKVLTTKILEGKGRTPELEAYAKLLGVL